MSPEPHRSQIPGSAAARRSSRPLHGLVHQIDHPLLELIVELRTQHWAPGIAAAAAATVFRGRAAAASVDALKDACDPAPLGYQRVRIPAVHVLAAPVLVFARHGV